MMKIPALVLALAPLSVTACAVVPPADSTPPQPAGYAVPIGQPVQVGDLILTPRKLVEDSRCPMEARCAWAGQVRLLVRIGTGRRGGLREITSNTPIRVADGSLELVSVMPPRSVQRTLRPRDYRFAFRFAGGY